MINFIDNYGPVMGVIICIIILCATFWAYNYIYRTNKENFNKRRHWLTQLPAVVSTLGVLGTFLGITIGLLAFDTENLPKSIPHLLEGLKTAFYTSLLGMIGSLWLNKKVSHKLGELEKPLASTNPINIISDLHRTSKEQLEFLKLIYTTLSSQTTNLSNISDNVNKIHETLTSIHADTEQTKDDLEELKAAYTDSDIENTAEHILNQIENLSAELKEVNIEVSKIGITAQLGALSLSSIDNNLTLQHQSAAEGHTQSNDLGEDLPF